MEWVLDGFPRFAGVIGFNEMKPGGYKGLAMMKYQLRRRVVAILMAACAATGTNALVNAQGRGSAQHLLASQFIDDARSASRNLNLPSNIAAAQALTLLEEARHVDGQSVTALRLLAEAAQANGDHALQAKVLQELVNLKPDDVAAQVKLFDAIAARRQTVAGRITVYRTVLAQISFNQQVRSAMAQRIGGLLEAQGRKASAADMYLQAVKLNGANLAAWQALARTLAAEDAPVSQRLYALLHALRADPYQPDALAAVSDILADGRDYKQAAAWANSAIRQYQQSHRSISPVLATNLAAYWAIAGQDDQYQAYMGELLGLPHPVTPVLMIALTRRTRGGFVTGPTSTALLTRIHKRLAAAMKADPKNMSLQADDVWLDLFYNAKLPADIAHRVASLEKKLPGGSPEYYRLRGWQLLRQGFSAAALTHLKKAGIDPYARLGIARILASEHNIAGAGKVLQQLWNSPLPALPTLDVAQEAAKLGVKLKPTAADATLSTTVAAYPKLMLDALDHPGKIVLVTTDWSNRFITAGDPMYLRVHYYNTSPYTLAVGPDAAITTSIALAGSIQGVNNSALGVYAVDSNAPVLRLEPQGGITVRYRVDQGELRKMILTNPISILGGQVEVITNPLALQNEIVPGLGGLEINAGYFNVDGFCAGDPTSLTGLANRLSTIPRRRRMLAAGVLARSFAMLASMQSSSSPSATAAADAKSMAALKKKITDALMNVMDTPDDDAAQAWLLRWAPLNGLPHALAQALDSATSSDHAVVRMEAYWRILATAEKAGKAAELAASAKKLAALAHSDKNAIASAWANELSAQAALGPVKKPTTAPAKK
jgi:tetratricopeptide (TPR) repeat protein